MTNTPPPTNNDDAVNGRTESASENAPTEAETPVFDDVATEHPDVQDAAPDLVEPATPQPTPVVRETTAPEQEAPAETPEAAGYDEHIDEPRIVEARTVEEVPAPMVTPPARPVQTVYVSAPIPPKKKGNRGYGVLFAFLGTLVFAILFAAVIALILLLVRPQNAFGGSILGFIGSSAFWVPVAVFFVVFVLFALLVNRGNWVAWVLSSFLVAMAAYLLSIGIILLLEGVLGMTPAEASQGFSQLALSAPLIVAAILAREVTIWFGAAIASRGRKVKERNLEARSAYERELDNQPLGFS